MMFTFLAALCAHTAMVATAQQCTKDLCCHEKRYNYCKDNTYKDATVAYTSSELALNTGDHSCGTGYKDKANKAQISGSTNAKCCDAKTCSDLTCPYGMKPKSSPTQPSAGADPTSADCCEDRTSYCSVNKQSSENVVCPSGFDNKGMTYMYASSDDTNAKKYAKCCMQRKCIKNVMAVVASCQVQGVSQVQGTCNLAQGYTEKSSIETLPSDPSDWSNPGTAKSIQQGSNLQDCCNPPTSCSALTCPSGEKMKNPAPTSFSGSAPTTAECCEDIQGMCTGNKLWSNNFNCGTGYKGKANTAGISGSTTNACCDTKTCSDFSCSNKEKRKGSPGSPAQGSDPTSSLCCEDRTGMCQNNMASANDVSCGTGYRNKPNKNDITGNTVAACCDQKTCQDLSCPTGKMMKANPTQPAAGSEPDEAACCEPELGTCLSYTKKDEAYDCGSAMYAKQIQKTYVQKKDCANNAFDVWQQEGTHFCPAALATSLATRSTSLSVWHWIVGSGVVLVSWCSYLL